MKFKRSTAEFRIISLNLNGVRSANKKGVFDWIAHQNAQVICVQEVKAQMQEMTEELLHPHDLHSHFHYADKKGYSGTGIYTRIIPNRVSSGFGSQEFDAEGRYARIDCQIAGQPLAIISTYFPSGSSSPERQQAKFRFLEEFFPHLQSLKAECAATGREILLCGDWNIAHQAIDLKNWRSNQKNSGFLPEERAWLTRVFDELGFVDVFRKLDQRADQYTWWSNRGQAWAKNVGWRIDYQIATPKLAACARHSSIYTDARFSDHAPLIIEYQLEN